MNAARLNGCTYAVTSPTNVDPNLSLQSALDSAGNKLFNGPFCLTDNGVVETVGGELSPL